MVAMVLAGALLLCVDLLAKRSAESTGRAVQIGRLATIRHVSSRRTIYTSRTFRASLVLLWVFAFAAAALLSVGGPFDTAPSRIALGAALGGAAGNLFDILSTHAVRDYIELRWWPVFNIADIAILGGLAFAFLVR